MQALGEHGIPTTRFWRWAALATAAFWLVSNGAYVALGEADHPGTVLLVFAVPLLVIIPFSVLRGLASPAERAGWLLLAVSHLVYVAARVLRYLEATGATAPGALGRAAFLLQIASTTLVGLALLAWPLAPPDGNARRRQALDALVFAAALFFLLWASGWGERYRAAAGPAADKLFTLAFPLVAIAVAALAVSLGALRPEGFRGPLAWTLAWILAAVLDNLAWGFLTLRGEYRTGHPIDVLPHLLPLFRALATFSPRPVAGLEAPRAGARDLGGEAVCYLPVLPALAWWAWRLAGGKDDPVLDWTVLAMVVLLLTRQYLALRDVRSLTVGLEAQVADRTRALEESMAALMRTQRMNLVATLGAGLAHDFKNLLTVIRSSVEEAALDVTGGRPPQREDLEAIRVASLKAGDLASRLLALGRPQRSAPGPVDLAAVVLDSERLLRALAQPPIELEVIAEPGPLEVRADPLELQQVLVNLVANARDAMPRGGLLRVSAARDAARRAVVLTVSDTGTGMSAEVTARAYEPFFTTKGSGKGTGLGLASVKAIVEALGGSIELASAPGKGTTFTLVLPGA